MCAVIAYGAVCNLAAKVHDLLRGGLVSFVCTTFKDPKVSTNPPIENPGFNIKAMANAFIYFAK